MIKLKRTDAKDPDFTGLVDELNAYLAITDGAEHGFYDQYNGLEDIKYTIVVYLDNQAVSCGAIKHFSDTDMEVKRMYTHPSGRGQGLASQVLKGLEIWAKELGYTHCILETGKRQIEANSFYPKNGYERIPNYGQYKEMENSVCFRKALG